MSSRRRRATTNPTEIQLQNMIMTFRVSELQMLLGFAGQNKTGRKNELQSRAMEMVKNKSFQSPQIISKIRELYKSIQSGAAGVVQEAMAMGHSSHGGHSMPQQMMAVARTQQMSNLPGFHPSMGRTTLYGVPHTAAAMYPGYAQAPRGPAPPPQQPPVLQPQQNINLNPDVTLKRIPFYEVEGVLLRPTLLISQMNREPSATMQFYIPPKQADAICFNRVCMPGKPYEYPYQVQMRFCVSETSCEQEDSFPPGIVVKVNGKPCTLPSGPMPVNKPPAEIKRPPRPVNISTLCKLCPSVANTIQLSWTPDYTRGGTYVVGVWCVKTLKASDLLEKLKAKGPLPAESTVNMIKEKLQEDEDIATTELRVSLICPLGKMMMSTPIRPVTCTHLQCFDATIFLQMNEKKPTWSCPVCNKPAIYDNLVIDSYFSEVLSSSSLPSDCNEVLLNQDGSWSAHDPSAKRKAEAAPKISINETIQEINDLDSDDSLDTGIGSNEGHVKTEDDSNGGSKMDTNGKVVLVDLTETDSEDESAPPKPSQPKSAPPPPLTVGTSKDDISSNGSGHRSSPSIIMLDSPSPPPREPSPPMTPTPVVPPPLAAAPLQRPPSSEQRSPYGHILPQAQPAHQMQPAPSSSPYAPPGMISHPTYHPQVHQATAHDHQMQSYANYMPPSYDSRYHPY